jgi:hypothetical protein
MTEPITTAIIVGLAAQKFAEGAAGKSAEKLVERLWDAIVSRFSGRKKTEENLATIAAAKGQDAGAIGKVAVVLDGEFVEDEDFAASLKELAQQIVTIQHQSQSQQNNNNYGRDQIVINQPTGNLKVGGS